MINTSAVLDFIMDYKLWQLSFCGLLCLTRLPCSTCDQDGSMVFVKEVLDEDSNVVEDLSDGQQQHEIFVPSKVWQKVKPGQPLPSGLHYRINLATGKKEAKLLDDEDRSRNLGSQQDAPTAKEGWKDKSGKFNFLTEEQLRTKFASIPDDGPKHLNANEPYEPDLSQYKNIDELKRDFEALNAQIQTESEIVTDLVSELRTCDHSDDVLLTKLEDLSFYMHQIDNAQDFVLKMNGLELIRKYLNHSQSEVRQSALKVLTACLQANQKLKVFAIENGQVLNLLTQILTSEQKSHHAVTKSALYSLSALLRNFPFAQKLFADMNGFDVLCDLVHSGVLPSSKVVQLKADLIMEARMSLDQILDLKNEEADLVKQYKVAGIHNKVGCACNIITLALETARESIDNLGKIDSILDAVVPFQSSCPSEELKKWFSRGKLLEERMKEVTESKLRSQNGANDALEYHTEVLQKLSEVLKSLGANSVERDEL